MKITILALSLAIFGLGYTALGLEQAPTTTDSAPPPPTTITTAPARATAPARLSSAATEVLKLVKAKVDEQTIVAFISNSGTVYNLTANEIIDLKSQGVSDAVLTAMLQQTQRAAVPPAYGVAPQAIPTNMPPGMVYAPTQETAAGQPVYVYPDSNYYGDYPYSSGYYPYYYSYPYYYYGYYPYWWGYYPYCYGGYYYRGHYYCYPYHGYHGGYYHGGYYGHNGYNGGYAGHGVRYSGGAHGGYAGYHGGSPAGGFHGGANFAVSRGGGFSGGSHGGGGHGGGGHR